MRAYAGLLPAIPFLAAAVGLLFGPRFPRLVAPLAVYATGAALVLSLPIWWLARDGVVVETTRELTPTGAFPITVGTRVDGLAAVVAVMVCAVALAVQVYSTQYLHGDRRYSSYAALVSLFTAAMLTVVLSGDLIVLLIGWEVMGICSYFLIGHYWEQDWVQGAAVKAFVMTKLGDVPFLFGIFVLAADAGSFRIGDVLETAQTGQLEHATLATLLLLGGVVGKSAQFPLHSWLPDAMAGPTPISALIHAATMVAAGMYLVARLYPAFAVATATLAVLGVIAAITMVGSAVAAFAQDDIKRVLAYSTVSQLAYMGGALAVGAVGASMFHLLTHGAFKALLFLCAGAVIHVVGTNSLRALGGLRAAMPITFVTMTLGLAALVGIPPLAGFFSKEAILTAAEHVMAGEPAVEGAPLPAAWVGGLVLVAGLVTVVLTTAYCTRLWLMTFLGSRRAGVVAAVAEESGVAQPSADESAITGSQPAHTGSPAVGAAHDPPPAMSWTLVALAVPTVLLGFFGLSAILLPKWLPGGEAGAGHPALVPGLVTSLISVGAIAAIGWYVYRRWAADPVADLADAFLGRYRAVVEDGFGIDRLYNRLFVRPTYALAHAIQRTDDDVVDASVRGSGTGARALGAVLRRVQTGNVQTYLTGILVGALVVGLSVAAAAR
ncbi:MAG TPA: NADH-quinone oxidoreductase subunit L [Actinomycetes bacterium]|nr:NADH-quinone oxidoreductase subunit L [Actinomycetes bacterium]